MRRDAELTLIWLLSCVPHSMCHSLPGRPRLIKCQSPEKETFTCWWEPGSAGGLPINHHLYYRKESSVEVFECPDYHKAGNNSCYFDKRHTSIWIIYNITVVASNALGKAYSEPVEVDVMDIVQPHPPENVNVTLIQTENSPYFLVQWQPPHDVDTSSGWVTIKYEARIKLDNSGDEEDSQWELYSAGKQLDLSIYSPQPGGRYIVQVRCRLDHSLWSEWSPSAFIQIPDKASDTQMAVMILAVTLLGFIFLFTAGVLAVKMKHVKLFLLPPVPVPKISGLDTQLLKSGKSEEIYSALITQGYPQIAQSSDHQVEYIVVSDNDEEMEFNGRALLESQKGENCSTDPAEKIPKDSSQELNSINIEQGSSPGSGDDIQNCIPECDTTFTKIHPGMISPQLGDPNTENDCNSMTRKVSITLAGLTGYVEVNEKEREQKPQVGEDYSMVSEVLRDNILVLEKDSTPILGHKVVNCEKSSKTQETGGEN